MTRDIKELTVKITFPKQVVIIPDVNNQLWKPDPWRVRTIGRLGLSSLAPTGHVFNVSVRKVCPEAPRLRKLHPDDRDEIANVIPLATITRIINKGWLIGADYR